MILLIYFIVVIVLLIMLKNKSIALLFISVHIISLACGFLVGNDFQINSLSRVFNLVIIIFALTMLILPWVKFYGIKQINEVNPVKVERLTKFLLWLSLLPFIVFSVIATFVFLYVDDINAFKYAEGVSTDFYYSLPINVKFFILSTYLYNFSYFLIPLHFYYLSQNRFKLSILCLIFSLNVILYGLTFFSRSVFIHYVFIYASFLFLTYNTLDSKIKRFLKVSLAFSIVIFATYFIYISIERFETDAQYAALIPQKSLIQDPILYSYFDYLSQWYVNGSHVLDIYEYKTFSGQITFQPVLSTLGQYGIISYNGDDYVKLRMALWPDNWWTFNGYVAYSIYDYGYILTILLSFVYFYWVRKNAPTKGKISILNLFSIVLLIQLPLMAIFYSNAGVLVIPFLFLLPMYIYLKVRL